MNETPEPLLSVRAHGRVAEAQLAVMRLAARSGHIRTAVRVLGKVFPASTTATVELPSGNHLDVWLNDPYWCRICVGWEHEPEVRMILDDAFQAQPGALLLDCGANIGYWSARYAPKTQVVAVEALPDTYRRLADNADRGGFTALHRAVWHTSGDEVQVHWDADYEAAAGIDGGGSSVASVPTVTIDELVRDYASPGQPVVVKLDVEGAEIPAVEGAASSRDAILWVYEDHGQDRTHRVTRNFLDLGFTVLYRDQGPAVTVTDAATLDAIKTDRTQGYNFVAVHPGGPWR